MDPSCKPSVYHMRYILKWDSEGPPCSSVSRDFEVTQR